MPDTHRPTHRWLVPTPGRLVLGSLAVEGLLFCSEQFHWFAFNRHKGWTALIAAAAVGAVFAVILLWFGISLLFRGRFQFSIRSLLLLTVAVALPCSWLSAEMKNAKRQSDRIRSLEGAGGHVYYDYECDGSGGLLAVAMPATPSWLLRAFGKDQFANVVEAAVDNEAGLDCAKDLHTLQILLVGSEASPAKLPSPPSPGGVLILDGFYPYRGGEAWMLGPPMPTINAESLKRLGALADLRQLELSGYCIGRTGLEALAGLRHLRRLSLPNMFVMNDDGERQMMLFDLDQVTEASIEPLKGLTQLQQLDLSGTLFTDANLEQLELARLDLLPGQVGELEGTGMKLRGLPVDSSGVKGAGMKTLQQALPNCEIIH